MEKILKKYTTIPQHLYVERSADIQLKRIIEEMQRPGYVLVARQMGKTNLLFNAKRTLENENRLFAYVDLSNLYTNDRDCYRNIIDSIIEPNLNIFNQIEDHIKNLRDKNYPSHNEYHRSLITILEYFKGDLVIILDEIDALKSIDYSDNIFAQIRSNYFSRTSYPVLERLTYALSGVIEPTELIKDKNKSPFNIGDKIYLDDFSKEEHNSFIKKSKLQISNEISNEIFNWTNGNPRLTFDICAEVENEIINGQEINFDSLNFLITKKYLTSFDIAPIDHIRELAKSNKDIRKAIINIYNHNSSIITDEIKKKLYLYGIINSDFNNETKIKNKIIQFSLSEDWIKSIDKENSYLSGLTKYSDYDYKGAIETLTLVLKNTKKVDEIDSCNYFIGMSYLKIKKYSYATKYFSWNFSEEPYIHDALAYLGVCQMAVGDNNGISTLEKALKKETNSHAYLNALLNLAVNIDDKNKALELFEKLYESTFKSEDGEENELINLRVLSLHYQAELYEKQGKKQEALSKIELALEISTLSDSLLLLYNKNLLLENKDVELSEKIINHILLNNLKFNDIDSSPLSFSEIHVYYYLELVFGRNVDLFERFLNYAHSELLSFQNKHEILYLSSRVSKEKRKEILTYLLNIEVELDNGLLLKIYSDLLLLSDHDPTSYLSYFKKYLKLFSEQETVDTQDVYRFAICIKILSEKEKISEAINLCEIISNKINELNDEDLNFESVIIYYWFALLYYRLRDKINAIKFADLTLKIINESNEKSMSMIDDKGLKSISDQVTKVKNNITIAVPIKNVKKYSRNARVNVRYKSGEISTKKFKHIEADLIAGKCMII